MNIRHAMHVFGAVLLLAGPCTELPAQQRIEETHPATEDTVIRIETMSASVRVIGWNEDLVRVVADVDRGPERLEIAGDTRQLQITLQPERDTVGRGFRAGRDELEVHVPAGARVQTRTVSGRIVAEQLTGAVDVASTSGSIRVSATPITVEARTVSGSIEIAAPAERVLASSTSGSIDISEAAGQVRASSTSGAVRVRRATGSVHANTVSGSVEVNAAPSAALREVSLESTSGRVEFRGDLADGALLEARNLSGVITLSLPASVNASFSVSTFSGSIDSDFEPPEIETTRRADRRLAFVTGTGAAQVSLQSFSGAIRLQSH